MIVDLGDKQYIQLQVGDGEVPYTYWYEIMLNSFNQGNFEGGFESEEEAYEAGAVAMYSCIQNHIDHSTQKMCDQDMELVVKFFNEVNK